MKERWTLCTAVNDERWTIFTTVKKESWTLCTAVNDKKENIVKIFVLYLAKSSILTRKNSFLF